MKKSIFFVVVSVILSSCFPKKQEDPKMEIDYKLEMIQADRDFSKLSEEKGSKAAFLEYIDSDGVLLRPNQMPQKGANAINIISQENDTGYIMTWEPTGGSVCKSGDMGYTYGIYRIQFKNKDSVQKGTYVSVWKKQTDGKWKFVMDSGNDGLGEP